METVPMSRQLDVSPGAFAFVMATGIVARGAHLTVGTFGWIVLLGVAVIGYLLLFVLTMLRIVYEPRQVLTDLASHRRGPGALALVAATGILGIELAPFSPSLATALWLLQLLLWLIVTYAFFTAIVAHERKPQATRALSGSWLLTVVATDSVALLATLVASQFEAAAAGVLFIATSLFFSACVLYFALIPLIVNRLEFLSLTPQEFTPDYWINMGARAP